MQPTTSYWPPTRSPALQLRRERERRAALRAEALGAARPARRATGRPARRTWSRSACPRATSGLAMTIDCGSGTGADGHGGDAGAEVLDARGRADQATRRPAEPGAGRADRRARQLGGDASGASVAPGTPVGPRRRTRTRAARRPASRRRCSSRPRSDRCSRVACTVLRSHDGLLLDRRRSVSTAGSAPTATRTACWYSSTSCARGARSQGADHSTSRAAS